MNEMDNGFARVEREGYRADVVVTRAEKRNAMNRELIADLTAAFRQVDADDEIRAVTLLGEGDVLSAGMDLPMMEAASPEEHWEIGAEIRELFDTIDHLSKPVVVGIKRAAVAGAFELTLPCDIRIIGEEAAYGVIEVKLGVLPYGGTTQRLPRLVGLTKAKELVLTGDFIEPQEAERIGLVNEVVPDDEVDERARAFADKLTTRSPLGIEGALQAFRYSFDVPLSAGLDMESELGIALHTTADRDEGFAAALEGREPEFEGR